MLFFFSFPGSWRWSFNARFSHLHSKDNLSYTFPECWNDFYMRLIDSPTVFARKGRTEVEMNENSGRNYTSFWSFRELKKWRKRINKWNESQQLYSFSPLVHHLIVIKHGTLGSSDSTYHELRSVTLMSLCLHYCISERGIKIICTSQSRCELI